MGKIRKESRFIKCYKYKMNLSIYSEYEETETPGEYRCIYTSCPIYSESSYSAYAGHRCNGTNDHGFPCSYGIVNLETVHHFSED